MRIILPLALLLALPLVASAGPNDDPLAPDPDADDEIRPSDEDDLDFSDDEDEKIDDFTLDEGEDAEDAEDLLGEEDDDPVTAGGDTAALYRAESDRIAKFTVDEQLAAWEAYLNKYPGSVFRERIDKRMQALEEQLYSQGIDGPDSGPKVDANKQEVRIAQALTLENINPRTRLQFAFEWGLPNYLNLVADYEKALSRTLSVHGGVRHRYTGWSVEPGVRWALVKSSRTKTLVTFIGDLHINTDPVAFLGVRPQLAVGKIFGDKLHLQAQLGPDLELRGNAGFRFQGGANITYRAAETVALFAETNTAMKYLAPVGMFRFNIISFGMKFYPGGKSLKRIDAAEVNVGASVPYTSNYWMYHFGSVMAQGNLYLDDM